MGTPLSLSLSLSRKPTIVRNITSYYLFYKINDLGILNLSADNRKQYGMINRIKEFSDIAFQGVTGTSIVPAYSTHNINSFNHSLVSSLSHSARKRIIYESRLEYRIQNREKSMMKHSVTHSGFMNPAQNRIMYPETLIWSMFVYSIFQISMQVKNILLKIKLKNSNIGFMPFAMFELIPGQKQVLRIGNFGE